MQVGHTLNVHLQDQLFTVVGAAGFVGQRLVSALQARGAEVYAPPRDGSAWLHRPLGHVMYCAGLTADYLARPFDTVQAHVGLLSQVLQHGQWKSLVYLSSTRLYDSLGGVIAAETLPLLLDPSNSRHLYDLSKALGESMCHGMGQGRARVARLACVYEGESDADGFLPALLRQVRAAGSSAATGAQIAVASSPLYERDYIHVADVVDALILIATRGRQATYNVASGANVSNAELFAYLERHWHCQVLAHQQDAVPASPRIAIDRLRDELGWQPQQLFDVLEKIKGAQV